jgi:hypothetical protein
LQRLHEIRQEAAFEERHCALLLIQRVLPLRDGVDLDQRVGAEPQPWQDAVLPAFADPGVRSIGPVRLAPGAIAAIRVEPESVDGVVIKADSEAAQAQDFVQLFHRQLLGQRNVVGKFVVGGPVVVDKDRIASQRSAGKAGSRRTRSRGSVGHGIVSVEDGLMQTGQRCLRGRLSRTWARPQQNDKYERCDESLHIKDATLPLPVADSSRMVARCRNLAQFMPT